MGTGKSPHPGRLQRDASDGRGGLIVSKGLCRTQVSERKTACLRMLGCGKSQQPLEVVLTSFEWEQGRALTPAVCKGMHRMGEGDLLSARGYVGLKSPSAKRHAYEWLVEAKANSLWKSSLPVLNGNREKPSPRPSPIGCIGWERGTYCQQGVMSDSSLRAQNGDEDVDEDVTAPMFSSFDFEGRLI